MALTLIIVLQMAMIESNDQLPTSEAGALPIELIANVI